MVPGYDATFYINSSRNRSALADLALVSCLGVRLSPLFYGWLGAVLKVRYPHLKT